VQAQQEIGLPLRADTKPDRPGRLLRLAIADDAETIGGRSRQRAEAATYLEGWSAARIVTEHSDGDAGRCRLTLVPKRPATICWDCPHYVPGSLPCVDG
jgi:TPP-dependent indolepyruvate ferredoxin oxidoreductase alpha subunit